MGFDSRLVVTVNRTEVFWPYLWGRPRRRRRSSASTGSSSTSRPPACCSTGARSSCGRKEFDLLARLVTTPARVVTREQLMAEVWDENWFGSTKTLDVHVALLRRKLGDDPGCAALHQTVRGVGFRFAAAEGG